MGGVLSQGTASLATVRGDCREQLCASWAGGQPGNDPLTPPCFALLLGAGQQVGPSWHTGECLPGPARSKPGAAASISQPGDSCSVSVFRAGVLSLSRICPGEGKPFSEQPQSASFPWDHKCQPLPNSQQFESLFPLLRKCPGTGLREQEACFAPERQERPLPHRQRPWPARLSYGVGGDRPAPGEEGVSNIYSFFFQPCRPV